MLATLDINSKAGLLDANPSSFRVEHNHQLAHATDDIMPNVVAYHRLVRRLIYLAITRPDLPYTFHFVILVYAGTSTGKLGNYFVRCVIS